MLKLSRFTLLSALLAMAAGAQAADEKTAALVNGVAIPQARVELHVKAAAQQGQPDTPEMRKMIRDKLIELEVISQAAVKNGLDKQPETAQQIEFTREQILAGAFLQDYVKNHPISEADMKKEYDAVLARKGNKEYQLSHILVGSEDEAKKVAAELKKGGKFAKIAKAKSKDPGSADKGGDLGWAFPSNFVQPFADAVVKLNKGQISDPVQTQYGWHIIKLENIRDAKVPTFEEFKPSIEKHLQQLAIQKAVEDLRSKAKIE